MEVTADGNLSVTDDNISVAQEDVPTPLPGPSQHTRNITDTSDLLCLPVVPVIAGLVASGVGVISLLAHVLLCLVRCGGRGKQETRECGDEVSDLVVPYEDIHTRL